MHKIFAANLQPMINHQYFFYHLIGGLSKAVAQRLRRKQRTLSHQSDSFMHL